MTQLEQGLQVTKLALGLNALLATTKIIAGVAGHSQALIADGIESTADIFGSFIVWGGLRVAALPADERHPFGHGRAETLASLVASLVLLGAATLIAIRSWRDIGMTRPLPPSWFTLAVLVGVVGIKEWLFRAALKAGDTLESTALRADAWHHRSDALTSGAAFVGIAIALIGGPGFESADDWAALAACAVIAWNGLRLLRVTLDEIMDVSVSKETVEAIRGLANQVSGVRGVEKCRVRKVGLYLSLDIHVLVPGDMTVHDGHAIGHLVKDELLASPHHINDVVVHIEPASEPDRQPPMSPR